MLQALFILFLQRLLVSSSLNIAFSRNSVNIPTDSDGNQTGHLIGLLYRILLYKEFKINSIWVFDGKPPQHKFD